MTLELFGPPPAPSPAPVLFSSYTATSTPDSVDPGGKRERRVIRLAPRQERAPRPGDEAEYRGRVQLHERQRQLVVDVLQAALLEVGRGEAPVEISSRDHAWLANHAGDIALCSEVLAFRHAPCGLYYVKSPGGCHSRMCPSCERRRAAFRARRVRAWLETVPRARRSYLVLTQRNSFDLVEGYRDLHRAFDRLRRRALWRGGACRMRRRDGRPFHPCGHPKHEHCRDVVGGRNCPWIARRAHEPVRADIAIDEVTLHECDKRVWDRRQKRWAVHACDKPCEWVGSWHPHINVLMDAPYVPQAELAAAWREVTCPTHRGRGCPVECDEGSDVVWIEAVDPGTVEEAVKYVTKPAALLDGDDPWKLVHFLLATRGRRLIRGHGAAYGIVFEETAARDEEVTVLGDEIAHDREGRSIRRKWRLPRRPQCCGVDSLLPTGQVLYDPPIIARREETFLSRGAVFWRPPARC